MKIRYLIAIVIGLLIFTEIFLRIFISKPSTQQYDLELGYTNIPGSQMIESLEGYSHVTFNKLGFNDKDPDENLKRKIFIMGDSYTEAFQVDYTLGYTAIMEKMLRQDDIDVIKLARDSFLPLHYPIVFNRYYEQYKPELTLLQLGSHTPGGLYDENSSIKYDQKGEIESYTLKVSDNDKRKEAFRIILNNSALAYYLMRRYKYLIVQTMHRIDHLLSIGRKQKDKPENSIGYKSTPTDEDYVKRLTYILKQLKGNVVVVYFPDPAVVYNNDEHNNQARNIIKAATLNASFGFIDLTDTYKSDFKAHNKFLTGFSNSIRPNNGHLNAYGHAVVAKSLVDQLKSKGYLNLK